MITTRQIAQATLFVNFLSALASAQTADEYSQSNVETIAKALAAKRERFASQDLKKYSGHYTMIAYRSATGSSEIHQHEADIFIVEQGGGEIVTGGKIVGAHTQKAGEVRGTSISGGAKSPLHSGDIIHIPAGLPHQILVPPGKSIAYFVIKVTGQ